MIIKIPLYFEVAGGIPPQYVQEAISILSEALESFVLANVSGKEEKVDGVILSKELNLSRTVKESLEAFAEKGGGISLIPKAYARARFIKNLK